MDNEQQILLNQDMTEFKRGWRMMVNGQVDFESTHAPQERIESAKIVQSGLTPPKDPISQ